MKEKTKNSLLAIVLVMTLGIVISCSKDEPEVEPTQLTVSPSQLTIMSEKNSSTTFTIHSNSKWNITCGDEWLMLSSTSGVGDATITVTSLTANESATDRNTEISITSDDLNETVTVRQLAQFMSDCNIGFEDVLTMSNSVAFKYNIGSKVEYFYAGFLSKSAVGWTEDKIVSALVEKFAEKDPQYEDDGFDGMDSDTEYYLCAVGYDAKGNRGELTKQLVRTKKALSTDPWVYITDITYSTYYWRWNTEPDGYTSKYYMVSDDSVYAWLFDYLSDAEIAYIIRESINKGNLTSISRGDAWRINRTDGSEGLFIATWGVNAENVFSSQLNNGYWNISPSSMPQRKQKDKRLHDMKKELTPSERLELTKNLKVYCVE